MAPSAGGTRPLLADPDLAVCWPRHRQYLRDSLGIGPSRHTHSISVTLDPTGPKVITRRDQLPGGLADLGFVHVRRAPRSGICLLVWRNLPRKPRTCRLALSVQTDSSRPGSTLAEPVSVKTAPAGLVPSLDAASINMRNESGLAVTSRARGSAISATAACRSRPAARSRRMTVCRQSAAVRSGSAMTVSCRR